MCGGRIQLAGRTDIVLSLLRSNGSSGRRVIVCNGTINVEGIKLRNRSNVREPACVRISLYIFWFVCLFVCFLCFFVVVVVVVLFLIIRSRLQWYSMT